MHLRTFLFDRVFSLERHEYVAVAWSFAYFFCVLSSYYILRPIRTRHDGRSAAARSNIPYLFLATFVVMILVAPAFGWVTSRYPRRVFLPWVYLFFHCKHPRVLGCLRHSLHDNQLNNVWLGRDICRLAQYLQPVRRVGLLEFHGGYLYARTGPAAVRPDFRRRQYRRTARRHRDQPDRSSYRQSQPVSDRRIVNCVVAVLCIRKLRVWAGTVTRRMARCRPRGAKSRWAEVPLAALRISLDRSILAASPIASVIASLLGTALYTFCAQLVETSIPDPEFTAHGSFSNINIAQNLFTLVGQMFMVRHVVRRFGIGGSLAIMPVVSIACFHTARHRPDTRRCRLHDGIARRALGFSFSKPTTDMLYSVVTPEEKYKTKNFIDTAIYRFGDVYGTFRQVHGRLGITGISSR